MITTSINKEYALRFLGVALLFVAFSGWFLYDGLVGYPRRNAEVAPLAQALAAQALTPADWVNTAKTGTAPLTEAFQSAGLQSPGKVFDAFTSWVRAEDPRAHQTEEARKLLLMPLYSAEDIRAQFVSAAIALVAALGLLCMVALRFFTRTLLDGNTLTRISPFGTKTFSRAELCSIEDAQWAKRGILKLHFTHGSLTLDAWHHAGTKALVEALKSWQA